MTMTNGKPVQWVNCIICCRMLWAERRSENRVWIDKSQLPSGIVFAARVYWAARSSVLRRPLAHNTYPATQSAQCNRIQLVFNASTERTFIWRPLLLFALGVRACWRVCASECIAVSLPHQTVRRTLINCESLKTRRDIAVGMTTPIILQSTSISFRSLFVFMCQSAFARCHKWIAFSENHPIARAMHRCCFSFAYSMNNVRWRSHPSFIHKNEIQ